MGERFAWFLGLLLFALVGTGGCAARQNLAFTPMQLTIAPNIEVFAKETPVYGLDVNALFGMQHEVKGLVVGPFNEAKKLSGISAGLLNLTREKSTALQVGIGNVGGGEERFTGAQLGISNLAEKDLVGLQLGGGNFTETGKGLQLGFFNISTTLTGAQLGIMNFTDSGVQIGVLNVNSKGFLPVFPLFNF